MSRRWGEGISRSPSQLRLSLQNVISVLLMMLLIVFEERVTGGTVLTFEQAHRPSWRVLVCMPSKTKGLLSPFAPTIVFTFAPSLCLTLEIIIRDCWVSSPRWVEEFPMYSAWIWLPGRKEGSKSNYFVWNLFESLI